MIYFLDVYSIRLTRSNLPSHAIVGEDVTLECSYDMEGDKLYSVKWYRNGKEFYRHIPSDSPPTAVFSQPGLVVDVRIKYLCRQIERGGQIIECEGWRRPRTCKRSDTLFKKSLLLFLTWREYFYSQPTHFSNQPKK